MRIPARPPQDAQGALEGDDGDFEEMPASEGGSVFGAAAEQASQDPEAAEKEAADNEASKRRRRRQERTPAIETA